jgi:hypothetical protein
MLALLRSSLPSFAVAASPRFPLPPGLGFCALFSDFLSPAECAALIASAETVGFDSAARDYPPSYRDNERLVLDDPSLADALYRRLAPCVLPLLSDAAVAHDDARWELAGLNPRLRFCRYRAGQQFRIHQDGVHFADAEQQSRLTFMIYLDEAPAFEGGDTLFYAAGPQADGEPRVVARVRPRAGSLIVFDHGLFHAGARVQSGTKHILRSDLMFRRRPAERNAPQAAFGGHRGYVWSLLALADGGLASGGRDAVIRLWSNTGEALGQLQGHRQSVLGLAHAREGELVSVSRDRTLRRWDLAQRRCVDSVVGADSALLCVRALANGRVASGGAGQAIVVWDQALRAELQLRGHAGWVWDLASHTPTELWSAGEDGALKRWELASSRCLETLRVDAALRTLVLSPDGDVVIAGDVRGRLSLFGGLYGPRRWSSCVHMHAGSVRRVRFLDGETLATTGEDGCVRCFAWPSLRPLAHVQHDNFATDVVALADGSALSAGYDGSIRRVRRARE